MAEYAIYGRQYARIAGNWERYYNSCKDKAYIKRAISLGTQTLLDKRNRINYAIGLLRDAQVSQTIIDSLETEASSVSGRLEYVSSSTGVAPTQGVVPGAPGRVAVIGRAAPETRRAPGIGTLVDLLA
jgi:hypothetical protein